MRAGGSNLQAHFFGSSHQFAACAPHVRRQFVHVVANLRADFNDGLTSYTNVHNVGIEHDWTITPTVMLTSRFALDRVYAPVKSVQPNFSAVNFPAILGTANGLKRMPAIILDPTNDWLSMYTQCCSDTNFAHTLFSYSSAISFVKHAHTLKVGFEQREFFNNFWQPNYPTGLFHFAQNVTASVPNCGSDQCPEEGNSFASLLMG